MEGATGRGEEKLPRVANASVWGDLAGCELAKLKLLNASFSPPKELWVWLMPVGEGIPLIEPDEPWETGCCGCGRGAVA